MRRWFDDTENVVEDGNADTSADAAFFLNLPATRICIFRGLLKVEDEGDENETVKWNGQFVAFLVNGLPPSP